MDLDPELSAIQCRSRMTVEQERDAYREKMLHMKVMVRDLQQKLESQKILNNGVETVSVLLKEARQENTVLENQKKALETAVRNLQNRLANHGLSNSVTLEENELFVPGTSKQILDNLAKENTRLQNLLGMTGSGQDASKLHEAMDVMSNLQTERDNLMLKIQDLENMLKATDSEKDKVINKLRQHNEKLQQESPGVIGQSTAGREVTQLRQQLKDVVVQCQQLELSLEEHVKTGKEPKHGHLRSSQEKEEESDVPDGNILMEENARLKEELKTLKEMNRRWQQYNNDRERQVQDVQSKYRELEFKYNSVHENRISEEKAHSVNRLLLDANEKFEKMSAEKQKVDELVLLQQAKIQAMSAEIQHLQSIGGGDPETISALKAQIQVCTEDFETERRDRVKAWAKVHQLSNENNQLRTKLQAMTATTISQPLTPRNFNTHRNYTRMASETPQLQARGWSKHGEIVMSDGGYDEEDGGNMSLHRQTSTPVSQLQSSYKSSGPVSLPVMRSSQSYPVLRKKTDALCCPKCRQGFSEDEHDKLLEHMDICCE